MNATEARVLSNKNLPQNAETKAWIIIDCLNSLINRTAKIGEYEVSTEAHLPGSIIRNVVGKVKNHFSERGYKVQTFSGYNTIVFRVSWSEQE